MYEKSFQTKTSLRGKTNKYGACRTAGFDSKKEWLRFEELKLLEKAGEVSGIEKQVPFVLYGKNGNKICTYKADFVYLDHGVKVIEDVKSSFTAKFPVFRIKWKLMEDLFKYEISRGEVKLLIYLAR